MKPIDLIPGMAPTREVAPQIDGTVIVYVTPPAFTRCPRVSVHLSAEQYARYMAWRLGQGMIQELLPDLSNTDREKLMSGLDDADFDRFAKDDDDG